MSCADLADAGFGEIELIERTVTTRFPTPDRFVERMEHAYAAVVPALADDPAAFAGYLAAITDATRDIVARYRRGDRVVVPMHTWVASAVCR